MKSFIQYIIEQTEDSEEEISIERGEIKFTIWKEPKVKVKWIDNNTDYQKIEYTYDEDNIKVCFLLGYVEEESTWKLWMGKPGSVNYDDDPYCNLETDDFKHAIVSALDKIEELMKEIKDDPDNWVQFYDSI